MKKIIYSLVIMIAAGSLFTSCIEQEEPSGIKNLRDAKAQYLASLGQAKVTYANAEKARAEAAAAYDQARAAAKQADAQATQIQNQLDEIKNKVADAQAQKTIDSLNALKEKFAADAQKATLEAKAALAKAEAEYQNAIDSLAAAAYLIEPGVASVIDTVASAYSQALSMQKAAEIALYKADSILYRFNQTADQNGWFKGNQYASKEYYQAQIEKTQGWIDDWNALSEKIANFNSTNEWATLLAQYEQEKADAQADQAGLANELEAYKVKEFIDGSAAYTKSVENYLKDSLKVPSKPKSDSVAAVKVDLKKSVIDLPDYLEDFIQAQTDAKFTYTAATNTFETKKNSQNYIDSLINGSKTTEGLKDVIAALEREYVVKESDHSGDAAIQAKIDSLKNLDIKAQFDADYDTLKNHLNDWYVQFKKDSTAFFAAADTLAKYINIYQDKLLGTTESGFVSQPAQLKKADTTALIAAINAYGKAEVAYLGFQDSIICTTAAWNYSPIVDTIAFSELNYDGFVYSKDSDGNTYSSIYGAKKTDGINFIGATGSGSRDAFARVFSNLIVGIKYQGITGTEATGIAKGTWSNTTGKYFDGSKGYWFANAKNHTLAKADFWAVTFANNPSNVDKIYPQKANWDTIIARFWGVDINDSAAMKAAYDYDYDWSYDTFAGLVDFKYNGEDLQIKYNRDLAIVLKSLKKDKTADVDVNYKNGSVMNYEKLSPFFVNASYTGYTELAQVFYNAKTIAKLEGQLAGDNLEVLAALKEFTAKLEEALAAAVKSDSTKLAKYATDSLACLEFYNTLTGANAKTIAKAKAAIVKEITINPAKWDYVKYVKTDSAAFNLAGLQKEYAEAALPTYVATCSDIAIRWDADAEAIAHADMFITPIQGLMNSDLEVAGLKDKSQETIDAEIKWCNDQIASYEAAIAKLEAGYEPYNVQKAILEGNVAECEKNLEAAKAYVALKKAAFDAIIAQYAK